MKDTISLTMIVKNEEKNLAACLDSVQDHVDEIIIVDTGSTDATLEIAKRYTPNVFSYPWSGNFSAARNYAIAQAKGSWIFSLDADEILFCELGTLKELINRHQDCDAFLLPLENPTLDASHQFSRFPVLRLFRNKATYRFSGSIHEQVILQDAGVSQIVKGPVIRHRIPSASLRNSKRSRNLKLLTRALAQDPQNPFLHYYLGIEWLMLNKPEKALFYLQTAYNTLTDENLLIKAPALRSLIICLQCLGKMDEAIVLCLDADFRYPDFTDIYYLAGTLFTEKHEFSLAMKWFKQALACGEPPEIYSHMQGTESYLSHYYLGYCYDMLGDADTARAHYESALHGNPKYPYPLSNLFLNLRLDKGLTDTYHYFKDKDYLNNLELAQILAQEFFNAGYPAWAKEILQRHLFDRDTHLDADSWDQVFWALGNYAFGAGELRKAQYYFEQISPPSEYLISARIKTILCLLLKSSYREAQESVWELWKQPKLRASAFLLLKLMKIRQNEKISFIPQTIRHTELKVLALNWFKEMLFFRPDAIESLEYSHFMRSLQTLIIALSPQAALELLDVLEQKKKEVETMLNYQFGGESL